MEIKQVFLKTRAEFGKQCIFDTCGPHLDEEIRPDPGAMANYIIRTHCNAGVQNTKQFALHEAQTMTTQSKNSGMFHFEGGWPKEINPKDEEATARFRRRVEKDDEWEPRLRNLFQQMEHNVLQNGAINIYEHYFDDMIPTELVKPFGLRTVNVYEDPQTPVKPVNDISWSPDSGSKIVVSYCFLEFGAEPDYNNIVYIWQIENPNKPWMTLEPPCATVVSDFNPRDPSMLASGLMSGQVCSWDIRTGTIPVQTSHRQFSHREPAIAVNWIITKSNTEFFSGSSDGRAMWWDTRKLREPTEVLVFDLQAPNEPQVDQAIGVSSANFESSVSTKFMFGLENGVVISGSRKARTPAEKLSLRFNAHDGPVASVDRNGFNPKIFLTVGDRTARVWAEDTRDSNLASTRFIKGDPVGGCWNKARHSVFYVITRSGVLTAWDLLVGLYDPIVTARLCEQKLTAIAAHEKGALLAVGNFVGNIFLVESTEALQSFDKNDKNDFASYLERCSRFVKAIDTRLKEIKLTKTYVAEEIADPVIEDIKGRKKNKSIGKIDRDKEQKKRETQEKLREHREKSRAVHREKKRHISISLELQQAEEKFFETVEKEKHKYEEDEELMVLPPKISHAKKLTARKVEKDSIAAADEAEEIKMKAPPKKTVVPKKTAVSTAEIARDVEQEKAMTEEESSPPSAEAIVESPTEEIRRRRKRKRIVQRGKRPASVAFKLPRPCKVGVCKPDVCCRGLLPEKLNARSADRVAVKEREKWIRGEVDEKTRSKDEDVRTRTPVGSKDTMRQKKRESWTELLRAHKRKRERIRFLREMMAPPEELAEDVERAKREIQEAKRSSGAGMRTRKLAKKASKSGTAEKSRDTSKGSRRDEGKLAKIVAPGTTKRILAARKGRRARHVMDPCAVWKVPSLAKDLETLLGSSLPRSIEEKASPHTDYFEEIEAARGRVYPRISDFHLVE